MAFASPSSSRGTFRSTCRAWSASRSKSPWRSRRRTTPFDADTPAALLSQQLYRPAESLRAGANSERIPADLDAIILKCLSKNPAVRYESMHALNAELERFEQGVGTVALAEFSGGF